MAEIPRSEHENPIPKPPLPEGSPTPEPILSEGGLAPEEMAVAPEVAAEKEFNPEAERKKIYERQNERSKKLISLRMEAFGADPSQKGFSPANMERFGSALLSAMEKREEHKDNPEEVQLTNDEKFALAYEEKSNEIRLEAEQAIEALDKRISNPKELKPEDVEKRMGEI